MTAVESDVESDVLTWQRLLDELELALEGTSGFDLPAATPPLPAELLPRARALLERQRLLTEQLEAERARVAAELDQHRRAARSVAPEATPPAAGAGVAL